MDYDAELKKYRTTAEEILKELKEQPKLTYEQFEGLLRAYTMARFLLPADTDEDEIDKLAAVSIARIYQIPAEKLIQTKWMYICNICFGQKSAFDPKSSKSTWCKA